MGGPAASPSDGSALGGRALPLQVVERAKPPVARGRGRLGRVLRRAWVVPVLWACLATGALIGIYFQPPGLRVAMRLLGIEAGGGTADPIAVPARRPAPAAPVPAFVAGLGRLRPAGQVVTIAPPFGAADARLAALRVEEGERVAAGQVLAVLDNERQLAAAAEAARATVASREAVLAQVRLATEASRAETRAALARAEIAAQTAARDFERVETLRQRGFAADQSFDQRRAARDEAAREVERLRASAGRFGGGPIEEQADVRVALRNLEQARADLDRALADLDRATVRSPLSGAVLSIFARPGEKPGSAGIMTVADTSRMVVEIEVYQAHVGRVELGAPVEVAAEALRAPLRGTVTRIGLEVGRQTIVDPSPAANTDARVVKVTATLDEASAEIAARLVNLQVTARILAPAGS
jgi:HlyD family secretion protein